MAHQSSDGMNYAPEAADTKPVVKGREFVIAAAGLAHGHINGQVRGLTEAGALLKYVYDEDKDKAENLAKQYDAEVVDSLDRILEDDEVKLVAAADIPNLRGPLGVKVMKAGKDYFTDKAPFTSLEQLDDARKAAAETGQKYLVYYSERLHVESAWHAGTLIEQGAIGDVVGIQIFGPHRINKPNRPDWFWSKEQTGGILTDIASHQFDQFLAYTNSAGGNVTYASVDNFYNTDKVEFEDFGEATLQVSSGARCYSRVDWFTPDGMRTWGDGRSFIQGTKGCMEVRKYMNVGAEGSDLIYLVDGKGEQVIDCKGKIGFPFFGLMILDCLNRTEKAQQQAHAFMTAELSMRAQKIADEQRAAISK